MPRVPSPEEDNRPGTIDMGEFEQEFNKETEKMEQKTPIPKAIDLYQGDINDAVIHVQRATGEEISPAWWDANIGNYGTTEEILHRFDAAYHEEMKRRGKL